MISLVRNVLVLIQWAILSYFVLNTLFQLVKFSLGLIGVRQAAFRGRAGAYAEDITPRQPGVTIIIPAYNEESVIVGSTKQALSLDYPNLEVIVVEDGSSDDTFGELKEAFELEPSADEPKTDASNAVTTFGDVTGIYNSPTNPQLKVVRKENEIERKADALNVGLTYASNAFVATTDADTFLDSKGIHLLMRDITDLNRPVMVAGGAVKPINGCILKEDGGMEIHPPKSSIGKAQAVEYLRSFYYGRRGLATMNALPLLSGAFSFFWRRALIAVEGFPVDTITEDLKVFLKLFSWLREKGGGSPPMYATEPLAWTEVPEKWTGLWHQRVRWHQGLLEGLWEFKDHLGKLSYGAFGLIALPNLLFFEALGPLMELFGLVVFGVSYFLGALSLSAFLLWFFIAFLLHIFMSIGAIVMSDISFRRYENISDLLKLFAASVFEQFGYRQFTVMARVWATYRFLIGHTGGWVSPKRGSQ
ncbi:glycosyltransferase [Candidatus Bipolaricaulota bacterium]|nr:glycosyltransferase [Candidatus Bipolaricaulota bacterium]